ncbi:MAG TPA: SPOR domain-containing protein, partial [Novosphingobium sp.]|nr:SPOR domain-containing protein [Novosphingobium sp.]
AIVTVRPETAARWAGKGKGKPAPATPAATAAKPAPAPAPKPAAAPAKGQFFVQVGAFSSKANADAAAKKAGGSVVQAGNVWRVRTGPFATETDARAALAKAKSAGYSDARIQRAD